jgi:hypothetical protein
MSIQEVLLWANDVSLLYFLTFEQGREFGTPTCQIDLPCAKSVYSTLKLCFYGFVHLKVGKRENKNFEARSV